MARRDRDRTGNLPPQLTSFIGRRREVAEVKRLQSAARLVTLTGMGGVGKTRLALHVAQQARRAFPDGVWLVQLDRLRDESLLAHAVAEALHLPEQPGKPPAEVLADYLRGRRSLLVLDNCEHLADAAADLVNRLLRAVADLRVLATSREPLDVPGETALAVQPLPTPEPDRPLRPAEALRFDAVSLFAERARAVVDDFELTEANQAAVAQICHLLEGLPLAIELAVARLPVLAPEQIRDRLVNRLGLLTRGSRTAPARQQTLRACIDWSYELCGQTEQVLWARLSVFAREFDLDAAEQVCAGGKVAAEELVDAVSSLIGKSVLVREEQDATVRYRMLETLREYGAERLAECAEEDQIARRHRDYYTTLALRAEAAWTGPQQLHWARVLTRDHANLQAALEHCLREPTDTAAAQELGARLWFFWVACGFLREGRYYLDRALARGGTGREHRWALWAGAFLAGSHNDLDVADALAEQCHAEASASNDQQLRTYAAETQGMILALRGEPGRAVDRMRQCLTYYRGLDETDAGLLRTLPMLGVILVMSGDLDAALALAPECRELCERLGERWQLSYVDYFVGLSLRGKNEPARAVAHLRAAIETKHRFHDVVGLVMCIEPLAGAHADLGEGARTAQLLGAVQQLRHMFGLPASESEFHSGEHQRIDREVRRLLAADQYEQAFRRGQAMGLDEIVAYARAGSQARRHPEPIPEPRTADALTPRETQVAELVGQGLKNRDIATRLVIATRTAESHVQNIMTKLGFVNRAQLAAWITARNASDRRGKMPS